MSTWGAMKKRKLAGKINAAFTHQATPAIYPDKSIIYFMYKDPKNKSSRTSDNWDIWSSTKLNGIWQKGQSIKSINSNYFEGYPSITADGTTLFFVANSNRYLTSTGKLSQDLDIYYTKKLKGVWNKPVRLPEGVNFKGTDESGASVSPDGTTIVYFSEIGVNAKGGFDIYISKIDENGRWTISKNVGAPINSKYNETAPYLAPDGRSIYFSSDRPGGYGGYDFYRSTFKKGKWTTPKNLGKGINTKSSDLGLSIAGNGEDVYLSGQDKYKTWHIYKSKLPPSAQPHKVIMVTINIKSKKTKYKLAAQVILEDLDTGKFLGKFNTEAGVGRTKVLLVEGNTYSMTIKSKGFLLLTDNFNLKNHKQYKEIELSFEMAPLEIGASIILKNIFFKPGSHMLNKQSKLALNKFVKLLNSENKLKIEISGHTDSKGKVKINEKLSLKRANSVLQYFITSGLKMTRFKTKGYGSSKPVATNKTESGRAKNRRTEFKILSN